MERKVIWSIQNDLTFFTGKIYFCSLCLVYLRKGKGKRKGSGKGKRKESGKEKRKGKGKGKIRGNERVKGEGKKGGRRSILLTFNS